MERPAKPRLITSNVLSQSRDSPTYSHRSSHERSPQTQEDLASPSVRGLQRPPQADAIVKRNPSQTAWQVQGDQTTMVHGLHGNSHSLHPRQTILPSSVQDAPSIVFEQAVDSTVSIRMPTQDIRQGLLELPGEDYPTPNYSRVETPPLTRTHSSVAPPLSDASESRERELWRSPVELQDHELALFKTFVEDLSGWLDLFDEKHHFCVDIPQLALTNMGLMRAILAFSARHAAIVHGGSQSFPIDSTAAFQYYSEALNHLQRNMQYASYQKSPDIIATSLIVSAYEMIDGAGKSWDRHLKGVCYMHQAQSNDGASGGMGQAMWWAWVLQDVWAAFRERRGTFGSWTPKKAYIELEPIGVARRAIWLLAQVIDFTSDEEEAPGEADHQSRADRAMNLTAMLDEWERSLPKCFHPLPRRTASSYSFTPLWINPQVFGELARFSKFSRTPVADLFFSFLFYRSGNSDAPPRPHHPLGPPASQQHVHGPREHPGADGAVYRRGVRNCDDYHGEIGLHHLDAVPVRNRVLRPGRQEAG